MRKSRLSQYKQERLLELFIAGSTVRIAAELVGVQQRLKSDPLTITTNGLILIHLVYSGFTSAIIPALRFCFSR